MALEFYGFITRSTSRIEYGEHGKMSDEVRVKVGGKEYVYKKDESNVIPFMKTKGIVKTVTVRIKDED